MFFEDSDCTVEDADFYAHDAHERMLELDKKLAPMYKKLAGLESEWDENRQEEIVELRRAIISIEECADREERLYDYWLTQWLRKGGGMIYKKKKKNRKKYVLN